MKPSQKIILTPISVISSILVLSVVIGSLWVYAQPKEKITSPQLTMKDPFTLPPGIHLLSEEKKNSEAQAVPSKEIVISPKEVAPPPFILKAILISDHIRLASIGQHIVTIGDLIDGEKVIEIEKDRVILGRGDKKRTLLLSQTPIQLTVEKK